MKKIIAFVVILTFLIPSVSSAVTLEQLQAQLYALLAQLRALQQQLAGYAGGTNYTVYTGGTGTTDTVGGTGYGSTNTGIQLIGSYIPITNLELGPFLDRSYHEYPLDHYLAMIPPDIQDPYLSDLIRAITVAYNSGMTDSEMMAGIKQRRYGIYHQYLVSIRGLYAEVPPQYRYTEAEVTPVLVGVVGRDDTVLGRNVGITVYLYLGDKIPENVRNLHYDPHQQFSYLSSTVRDWELDKLTYVDIGFFRALGIDISVITP